MHFEIMTFHHVVFCFWLRCYSISCFINLIVFKYFIQTCYFLKMWLCKDTTSFDIKYLNEESQEWNVAVMKGGLRYILNRPHARRQVREHRVQSLWSVSVPLVLSLPPRDTEYFKSQESSFHCGRITVRKWRWQSSLLKTLPKENVN